jgi:hypothetical protein
LQDTTNEAGGLTEIEERAGRLERRLARIRGELGEAEQGAEFDIYQGVSSPNRKPRAPRPGLVAQEPAGARGQGVGVGGRYNPIRPKVKAATAGAIPGGLLGEYLISVLEGRYGDLPPELDALIVALVAAAGAFVAGYYKRDEFSPPS